MAKIFGLLIVRPFGMLLMWIYNLVGSYGVAIILFALICKLILLPLSIHSKKSMRKMSALSQKQMALQKKYANNRVKLNEEIQKLYEKEGVSPMSGCLPSFLPLPIMMGLYYAIEKPITFMMGITDKDFVTEGFPDSVQLLIDYVNNSGIADLTQYQDYYVQIPLMETLNKMADAAGQFPEAITKLSTEIAEHLVPLNFNFLGFNLAQTPNIKDFSILWLLPILSGLTALLSSVVMQKLQEKTNPTAAQMQGSMKTMLYIMPLMSVYLGFILPAALAVYWITNNILTMVQEVFLTWYMNKYHPIEVEDPKKKKKKPKPKKEGA
ncbi:MAG: YidC/Oxa1 family membrane protein insertase [Butyricicoccus pullicaecorum]|nr:YidC/Oxa1 family membrane protein insertase [Butyricicoccus pullicaecorum]MDO4668287.1 YidC/Oxa1 family membrane protein insertase [Butyricicoccus pullicaecorum]